MSIASEELESLAKKLDGLDLHEHAKTMRQFAKQLTEELTPTLDELEYQGTGSEPACTCACHNPASYTTHKEGHSCCKDTGTVQSPPDDTVAYIDRAMGEDWTHSDQVISVAKSKIEKWVLGIIGEDEPDDYTFKSQNIAPRTRNSLRAEQRNRLKGDK